MDDVTKKIAQTLAVGAVKKCLMWGGGIMAGHGIAMGFTTADYAVAAAGIVAAGWSFWNDWGKGIVLSQLEVLKAKSLAQADKMRKAGVSPVTVTQIADQSDKLTPQSVAKTVSTLPVDIKETIAPTAAIKMAMLGLGLLLLLSPLSPSSAQTRTAPKSGPVLTGDLGTDIKNKFQGDPNDPTAGVKLTGNLKQDAMAVWKKIQDASKTDLQYASLMAGAAKTPSSAVRKQCWDAIIAINAQTNGEGLKNPDGSDAVKPDPSLFTDVETIAEIMDSLSPQGPLFTSCAGAAELAKANVIQFISAAVSGAVGLAKLSPIPGL